MKVKSCAHRGIVLVVLALGAGGCANQFNNSLVEVANEIRNVRTLVHESLKEKEVEKIKRTVKQAQTSANRLIAQGRAIKAHDSDKGRALHKAFEKFLEVEEKEFNEVFPTVVNLVEQGNWRQVNILMHDVWEKGKAANDALKKAQQDFQKAYSW